MFSLDQLQFLGEGLNRAECALAHRSGLLIVPDWTDRGGVSLISPRGATRRILANADQPEVRPNGIALEPGGSILMAHLGDDYGGVFRLRATGEVEPVLTEVDGAALQPSNFVVSDGEHGHWLTVSTRLQPRSLGYRKDVADGFIVHFSPRGARIAADQLGYTNECAVHPSGDWLYANETFGRRLSRFALLGEGRLGARETVAEFGEGVYPDGLAFDAEGGAWITSIVSNRVLRVAPDGSQEVFLEDADTEHIATVEAAYQAAAMEKRHLAEIPSKRLRNISNLAFGGPDLRTAYLGCLLGDQVASFPAPVAGHPLPHWDVDLGPLETL